MRRDAGPGKELLGGLLVLILAAAQAPGGGEVVPHLPLEWQADRMTIEMKRFSALLKLRFPAICPGGEPGQNRLRYTVLPAE